MREFSTYLHEGNYIKRFLKVSVWILAVTSIAVWSVIFFAGAKQEFTIEKSQKTTDLMCSENAFTPTPDACVLPPDTENPIGGVKEEEIIEPEPDNYTGDPVKLTGLIINELPEWNLVLPPVTCPHYTQQYHSGHRAVDLVNRNCNGNNWVVAVDDGIITFTGWLGGYGYRVEMTHDNGFVTTYSHLSGFDVEVGDELTTGRKIGTLGSTGKSSGTHLHFEVIYNGVKINPEIYLAK